MTCYVMSCSLCPHAQFLQTQSHNIMHASMYYFMPIILNRTANSYEHAFYQLCSGCAPLTYGGDAISTDEPEELNAWSCGTGCCNSDESCNVLLAVEVGNGNPRATESSV